MKKLPLVILLCGCLALAVAGSARTRLISGKPVAEVLGALGEPSPAHALVGSDIEARAALGRDLVYNGRARDATGTLSQPQSPYFRCIDCHGTQREDAKLTGSDAEARLNYLAQAKEPLRPASTFFGIVNRTSWYNDGWQKQYGDLVTKARTDLRESIQVCAQHCSRGRKLEEWELDGILAYFWSLQYRMSDLSLTASELARVEAAIKKGKPAPEVVELVKSKYRAKSPATLGTPPTDEQAGFGRKGRPDLGKVLFRQSCLHCHGDREEAPDRNGLSDTPTGRAELLAGIGTKKSFYRMIREGKHPEHGAYMPAFTQERISDQMVEDLRAYLAQKNTTPPKEPTPPAATSDQKVASAAKDKDVDFHKNVRPLMSQYCYPCHGPTKSKGKLRLDAMPSETLASNKNLLRSLYERVDQRQMPPKDEPLQPTLEQRKAILDWIKQQLGDGFELEMAVNADLPDNGNYVPHELLFGPKASKTPAASPPRAWRMNPHSYQVFLRERAAEYRLSMFSNPFDMIPGHGFKDYAAPYAIDGPSTEILLGNAAKLAANETFYLKPGEVEVLEVAFRGGTVNSKPSYFPSRVKYRMPPWLLPLFDQKVELTSEVIRTALTAFYRDVLRRDPRPDELERQEQLIRQQVDLLGRDEGVRAGLQPMYLKADLMYRQEFGDGPVDEHGRQRLAPQELARALILALDDTGEFTFSYEGETYIKRDQQYKGQIRSNIFYKAASDGQLDSREGIQKLLRETLDNIYAQKPTTPIRYGGRRNLYERDRPFFPKLRRFFREYFGYPGAMNVFKDRRENPGHAERHLVGDTDLLVDHVTLQDKDVLRTLLTTTESFVIADAISWPREAVPGKDGQPGQPAMPSKAYQASYKFEESGEAEGRDGRLFYSSYGLDTFPVQQPVKLDGKRMGILTQPSWLVSQSHNDVNYAIGRGKWIRERLLGGRVPNVPINVDAKLSNDPRLKLRTKMEKTREEYCWQCHKTMDPLGLPFERFDHFGRWRETELDDPVDTAGEIAETGIPELNSKVSDPYELIQRLAGSSYVRQVFIRHVFRFWMGRNETPADAPTLQEADRVYVESNGSMREVLISLLSSDSFVYRKTTP